MKASSSWNSLAGCVPACLAVALLAAVAQAQAAPPRYEASLDAELTKLNLRACFPGAPPLRLQAGGGRAHAALESSTLTDGTSLAVDRRGIRVEGIAPGQCIAYRVDLSATLRGARSTSRRVGSDLLTNSGDWLWLDPSPAREAVELRFELPPGVSVSGPWEPIDSSGRPAFRVPPAPPEWEDHVAFGRFRPRRLAVAGTQLRIAILDGTAGPDYPLVEAWLGEAARAVGTLYGRFPLPAAQIVIVPGGAGAGSPVPWGQVARGGAPAALFVVDTRASLADLRADWTAVHELSHLLLPYVTREDAWASEGFASYYQNVLRARAGLLAPAQAWERLEAGFARGRRATRGGSLREASGAGYRGGQTQRVYWAGAAIALRLDVELRRVSSGRQSLDRVLEALGRCCLARPSTWSARELFARFDQLAGTDVAVPIQERFADATGFPEVADLYRDLGLAYHGGRVSFDPRAPQAALRAAIMSSPPELPVQR